MSNMKERRAEVLKKLDEVERDILKLIPRIQAIREAEATLNDEALIEWLEKMTDLEDGLDHIQLF